ncbi:MAG: hypothetical protein IMZ62_14985 [Chloroflexi bacterium]|nr:hypothetical protein [Chloroflexota bacterium]
MKHPLAFISDSARKPVFFALLAWTLVLFAVFQVLNTPLTTSAAPAGIVSHQFAWTPEKAQAILSSWEGRASLFAAFGLGFDYLFMPSYTLTVSLGALLVAGRRSGWLAPGLEPGPLTVCSPQPSSMHWRISGRLSNC